MRGPRGILALLLALLLLSILVGMGMGAARIPIVDVAHLLLSRLPGIPSGDWPAYYEVIIFQVRLPRLLLAVLVGAGLAASGVTYQGLFKNPMADPFILGVSSGAALGATLAITLRLRLTWLGLGAIPLLAFVGSLLACLLVYQLAREQGKVSVTSLILAGMAVGSIAQALVSLVLVLRRSGLEQVVFWVMGSFAGRDWAHIQMAFPYILVGTAVMAIFSRDLNLALLGEESARHLGVDFPRLQVILILAASLTAAAAVSVSGVIGFVGLVVPHMLRLVLGPDHRRLLPASILAGGAFMAWADTLSRTVIAPTEIPVGIVTALLGGPFFLYLLRRFHRGREGKMTGGN